MTVSPVLSLLGLALRGGNLAVGEEPVEAVARARDARLLILASDAADNTRRRVSHFADAGACIWIRVPFTKEELGRAVGRGGVAVCAVTDVGLAAAIAHRLAEADPLRFDETARRLDLKVQRAAERRLEQRNHQRNVRTGKYQSQRKAANAARPQGQKKAEAPASPGKGAPSPKGSRPSRDNRPKSRTNENRFAHSRPVKKGKGSYKKARG